VFSAVYIIEGKVVLDPVVAESEVGGEVLEGREGQVYFVVITTSTSSGSRTKASKPPTTFPIPTS
jgi:hypothetical protein